jgi:hypothetical protein
MHGRNLETGLATRLGFGREGVEDLWWTDAILEIKSEAPSNKYIYPPCVREFEHKFKQQ